MKSVRDIPVLENVPVFVRSSLNVPLVDGKVANAYRIKHALPTIEFLRKENARIVIGSHIGEAGTETLEPVYLALKQMLPGVSFCPVSTGPRAREAVRALLPGEVLVLENLRRNRGEVMNDMAFAEALAELTDVFVEDAFDTCHREHASIVSLPTLLPSYAGLQLIEEIAELSKALKPKAPSLAVIGGAKFGTKEPVIRKLLSLYTHVFVGGALANDFLAAKGYPVGKSLVSGGDAAATKELLVDKKLVLPLDSLVCKSGGAKTPGQARIAGLDDVQEDETILDHGPKTNEMLARLAAGAKTILWNGPLGQYEAGFTEATDALAVAIADSGAESYIGGGDTEAAIDSLGLNRRFTFISTGGGAMLSYLAKGTLPGIEALG
ncbi:MAG: phosphoglycerate kinase [bacterium]